MVCQVATWRPLHSSTLEQRLQKWTTRGPCVAVSQQRVRLYQSEMQAIKDMALSV
jgi:hypothetical protein